MAFGRVSYYFLHVGLRVTLYGNVLSSCVIMLTVLLHNYLACLLIRVGCIVITCDSDIIKC